MAPLEAEIALRAFFHHKNWKWNNGGLMIGSRKPKELKENPAPVLLFFHLSYMQLPTVAVKTPRSGPIVST